jgi:hypothetical protein
MSCDERDRPRDGAIRTRDGSDKSQDGLIQSCDEPDREGVESP